MAFILANNGFDVHIFDDSFEKRESIFDTMHQKEHYNDKYDTFLVENMRFELECLDSPLFSVAKRDDFSQFGFMFDEKFAEHIKELLLSHPNIKIFNIHIDTLNENETTVIATGHHTSADVLAQLSRFVGKHRICHFQPQKMVIDGKNLNLEKFNFVTDDECFVNLSESEYVNIYEKIVALCKHQNEPDDCEECRKISVESIAKRGKEGLRNCVFRPHFDSVCPREERPYASLKCHYCRPDKVLILEDFFSNLSDSEQKEIVEQIDIFRNCEILRYSKILRKTFLLAPACLNENMQIKEHENIYVCGGLAGLADPFEIMLMANYCAYSIVAEKKCKSGINILRDKTCIAVILENLLKKSVINFRLFNLKYDIINKGDYDKKFFDKQVEVQKFLSKSQVEKFKEKFYGKYF